MKNIPKSQIEKTIANIQKANAYNGQSYPFNSLDDRAFEILVYQIFKKRILLKDDELKDKFDDVCLMQGVGEKGRDSILKFNGKNVGIIQCKKYEDNITKPDFAREIIKFTLHYIKDKSLINDINNFTYFYVYSNRLAGTTIDLLSDFNNKILEESALQDWVEKVIKENKFFKELDYKLVEKQLKEILSKINIKKVSPEDINNFLHDNNYSSITNTFFQVKSITDNSKIEEIIQTYLIPILDKLEINQNPTKIEFDYKQGFIKYLKKSYDKYSCAKTLVFQNQQKKLEDFYYPLIVTDNDKLKFKIDIYRDNFVPKFKKVLITDNAGMGKSTIMKWLFLSVIKQNKGIPIFIELRKLTKNSNIIQEIMNELSLINFCPKEECIRNLVAEGNFIFFFDGYDEISEENRPSVTKSLEDFIAKSSNNLFILTSRPENALTTFSDFKKFEVQKLDRDDAFNLIKKLGNNNKQSLMLINTIKAQKFGNIKEFLENPLLVSLLYLKFEYKPTIPFKKHEFYQEVFNALFENHDISKGDYFNRIKKSNLTSSDFSRLLEILAFNTIINNEISYSEPVLYSYIQKILDANSVFKENSNSKCTTKNFIDDLINAVPLFQVDGLEYRWVHKSIQEFFTAEFICKNTKKETILQGMYESKVRDRYYNIFDIYYDIDRKTFNKTLLYPFCKEFIKYCEESYSEIKSQNQISLKNILRRQEACFSKGLIFFKRKLEYEYLLEKPNEETGFEFFEEVLLPMANKQYNTKFSGLSITYTSTKYGLFCTFFDKHYFIMRLLLSKNTSLFHTKRVSSKSNKFYFDDDIIIIDENPNSLVNKEKNFDRTTELLYTHTEAISSNKAKALIEEIEKDIEIENDFESIFSNL